MTRERFILSEEDGAELTPLSGLELPAKEPAGEGRSEPEGVGEDIGIAQMVSDLIKSRWESIDQCNGDIATLTSIGGGNEALIAALETIKADEMSQIGMLEGHIEERLPEAGNIEAGKKEAGEQIEASQAAENQAQAANESLDDEFTYGNRGLSGFDVYWMEEARSTVDDMIDDNPESDVAERLSRLRENGAAMYELCRQVANDVCYSDYLWDGITDVLRDYVRAELGHVYNTHFQGTEINAEETDI